MAYRRWFLTCSLLLAAACSDSPDDPANADAATGFDAPVSIDAPVTADAPVSPDAAADAETADAATVDGGTDGTPACHGLGFGAPTVTIEQVGSLPTMTGGTIALGIYDAVQFQVTSSVTGVYRGTWEFDGASTMKIFEHTGLNGATPPDPVAKNLTWQTTSATIDRQQTCGGSSSFSNGFTVRTSGPDTFLDIRSGSILVTYQKRP